MTALLASELLRVRSRRLFHGLLALATTVICGAAVVFGVRAAAHGFEYASAVPDAMRFLGGGLFTLGVVVGTAAVGAEWGSGSMTTLLTWEPRRGRVLAAKLGAVVISVIAAGLALALFLALVFVPAGARGTMSGIDGAFWREVGGILLRIAGLGLLGGTIGTGLAMIVRNSAGAIAVYFVYGIIVTNLLLIVTNGRAIRWLIETNVAILLGESVTFNAITGSSSVWRAAAVLAGYAVAILSGGYLVFRERDVT